MLLGAFPILLYPILESLPIFKCFLALMIFLA